MAEVSDIEDYLHLRRTPVYNISIKSHSSLTIKSDSFSKGNSSLAY